MSIHHEHPFPSEDDPVRRFRGRVGGVVSLWTAGSAADGAGLTVSSFLVANGEPAHVLGLVDPDSSLVERLDPATDRVAVSLLTWLHRDLADAFAGQAPAPGGPFRLASWQQTAWGPVPAGAAGWVGVRLSGPFAEVGWSVLLDGVIEHVELAESAEPSDQGTTGAEPLVHRRGRYLRPS